MDQKQSLIKASSKTASSTRSSETGYSDFDRDTFELFEKCLSGKLTNDVLFKLTLTQAIIPNWDLTCRLERF